jgi:CYTH domain-containing protein
MCEKPLIEKNRFEVRVGGHIFEVDEFLGANEGLVLAEVELQNENEKIAIPDWLGEEVTGQTEYYNSQLIKNPYSRWTQ